MESSVRTCYALSGIIIATIAPLNYSLIPDALESSCSSSDDMLTKYYGLSSVPAQCTLQLVTLKIRPFVCLSASHHTTY